MPVTLTIDDKTITTEKGNLLLWAALDNGIYIPHLCALRERSEPYAGCRLCFVEIEGRPDPVPACTEPVQDGMVVHTRSASVHRLQRTALELLLSMHAVDCGHCPKNRSCELQKIARHLKVTLKPKRVPTILKKRPRDESHPLFTYDPNKCILCGNCVWVCHEQVKAGILNFAYRGIETVVAAFGGMPLGEAGCSECQACVDVCPVGALVIKSEE